MRKVELATLSPGVCILCGGVTDRKWFLDMERIEDLYGSVYYCDACFDQMAMTCGYKKADEEELALLTRVNEDLERIVGDYRDLFSTFGDVGIDLLAFLDYLTAKKANRLPRGKQSRHPERVNQSTDESRSVDVPNVASDDKQLFLQFG